MSDQIQKATKKLWDRIQSMVGKALLAAVSDSKEIQIIKVSGVADETIDGIERVQNYGLTSSPPEGAETVLAFIGGNREHPVAIAVDHGKSRIKPVKQGETCLYSRFGQAIYLTDSGDIEIRVGGDQGKMPDKVAAVIDPDGNVFLGGENLLPTTGVLTGECLDPVTGVPFPDKSSVIFAKKA
jgi:phage baseplate assembly protein V